MELTALTTVLREAWLSSLSTSQANYSTDPSMFSLSPKVQFCANKYCQLANVKSAVLSADCGRTLRQYITHICALLCCTVLCGAIRHVTCMR